MEDRRSIDNHDGGSNENEEQAEYEGRARSVPPTYFFCHIAGYYEFMQIIKIREVYVFSGQCSFLF